MNRRSWSAYVFIVPALVYLVVFAVFPMLFAGWAALHRWHLLKPDHQFVGMGNFITLAGDPFFRNAVGNTLYFVLLSVPLGVISSLLVALLVSRSLRGIGFFRTLYYVPAVSSQVAISMVWIWILLPGEQGLVNGCLAAINSSLGTRLPVDTNFFGQPGWAMLSLVAMSVWIGLGPRMIIFLAGLHSIPQTLYEAADLDGCNAWQRFWYITLPQLAPTMLFVVVTTTIAAFQLFTPVYMITRGGPRRSTDVVLYHIYKEAWQKFEIGMASAQSYVVFAMILMAAAVQIWLMRRGLRQEGD
jgi:multiple sugar transport system permease protein